MNSHPYLRAYMAGIFAPSVALLIALTGFIVTRLVLHIPIPVERVIIFPMAVVPNAFGIWNMLYVWSRPHQNLPIGIYGALLPLILLPLGAIGAICGGFVTLGAQNFTLFHAISVPYFVIVPQFFVALAIYYLVWKYIVGFLNQVVGIA